MYDYLQASLERVIWGLRLIRGVDGVVQVLRSEGYKVTVSDDGSGFVDLTIENDAAVFVIDCSYKPAPPTPFQTWLEHGGQISLSTGEND